MTTKKVNCQNPDCGIPLEINLSEEEIKANNIKDIICYKCNGRSSIPTSLGEPVFHPYATDQYGKLRVLRTAA